MGDSKLPLAICKQAAMKLEAFINDINEAKEDDDLDPSDKEMFEKMAEVGCTMLASLINIVNKECDEAIFISEDIPMDEIPEYPEGTINLLDEEI